MVLTFKLMPGATFTDGSPVAAADVNWSFDRAVSVGGYPSTETRAGGVFRPDQFEAVDDATAVIRFDHAPKLSLPDRAVPVPFIINSKRAMANATEADPWATENLHTTTARSGA